MITVQCWVHSINPTREGIIHMEYLNGYLSLELNNFHFWCSLQNLFYLFTFNFFIVLMIKIYFGRKTSV